MTTNCIVVCRGGAAVVIDPGGEGKKIARFLERKKLTVGEYWLTHGHPDHVGGLSELPDVFPHFCRAKLRPPHQLCPKTIRGMNREAK